MKDLDLLLLSVDSKLAREAQRLIDSRVARDPEFAREAWALARLRRESGSRSPGRKG